MRIAVQLRALALLGDALLAQRERVPKRVEADRARAGNHHQLFLGRENDAIGIRQQRGNIGSDKAFALPETYRQRTVLPDTADYVRMLAAENAQRKRTAQMAHRFLHAGLQITVP